MNVLHVVSSLPTIERPHDKPFVLAQIESLRKEGINIQTLVLNSVEKRINYLTGPISVIKMLRKESFDLIHAHYSYCGWIAVFHKCAPLLVSLMGDDLLGTPNGRGGLTLMGFFNVITTRILVKLVDAVIVKSSDMKRKVKMDKVYTVPNGIDFDKFSPPRKPISKAEDLKKNEYRVLFVGNPSDTNKNMLLAAKAIEIAKNRRDCIKFITVFGVGQDEVAKNMRYADVLLFTSLQEGSPNVIKEAMACNLSIVSTDVGDVREIIGETKGCYITSFEPDDVAAKLEMAWKYGKRTNGRENVKHLEMRYVARKIVAVYNSVLKRREVDHPNY